MIAKTRILKAEKVYFAFYSSLHKGHWTKPLRGIHHNIEP